MKSEEGEKTGKMDKIVRAWRGNLDQGLVCKSRSVDFSKEPRYLDTIRQSIGQRGQLGNCLLSTGL